MSEPATVVVFRRWPASEGGDVLALFPMIDEGGGRCASYQHVGQHSAADYGRVIDATRPADLGAADVLALRAELERIGYVLDIRRRAPSWRELRKAGAS